MSEQPRETEKLQEQFSREAEERLKEVETGLLNIEQGQSLPDQIRLVFRGFHGLKGVAYYVNAREIIDLTNAGETLLMQVRDRGVPFRKEWVDLLLDCHDTLRQLLEAFRNAGEPGDQWRNSLGQLTRIIEENTSGPDSSAAPGSGGNLFADTAEAEIGGLEIYLGKWKPGVPDRRLVTALTRKLKLFAKSAAGAGRKDVVEAVDRAMKELEAGKSETWSRERIEDYARVSRRLRDLIGKGPVREEPKPVPAEAEKAPPKPLARRLEIKADYVDMLEDLVSDFSVYARTVTGQMNKMNTAVKPRARLWLEGMTSDLARFAHAFSQSLRRLHLVPVSKVFERYPRMVRDMAKRDGKQVELSITGGETEIERHQSERLAEPITHLIRNAVDHGVEPPEERRAAGKADQAVVRINASASKAVVTIEVSDDGRGIDFDAVRKKAVQLNLYGEDKVGELPGEELMNLIFLTGLSTKDMADTISGRGVGMDIVRQAMEELGGSVTVSSEPGHGTTFSLRIPMDLD